jgi:hypothetical protein
MQKQKGMTLIELALAAFVATVLVGAFFLTFTQQQRMHVVHLDHLEAQQQGKAALEIVRSQFLQAGYGLPESEQSEGIGFVGGCFDLLPIGVSETVSFCDNTIEDGRASDKTRLMYMRDPVLHAQPDPNFLITSSATDSLHVECNKRVFSECDAWNVSSWVIVSGFCNNNIRQTELFTLQGSSVGGDTVTYDLQAADGVLNCGGGAYSEIYMGQASIVDFYVQRRDVASPQLRMHVQRTRASAQDFLVASGVYDFQVQYGIRLIRDFGSQEITWCNGIGSLDGPCVAGFNIEELRNHIVAVRIALVMQGKIHSEAAVENTEIFTANVFNNASVFRGDGFDRWVYRSAVSLRNGAL